MNELIEAVVEQLRSSLKLDTKNCSEQTGGQPPPTAGEWYYAVHQGEWNDESGDEDLTEIMGIEVTITRRCSYTPADRQEERIIQTMRRRAKEVVVALHKNYANVMNIANNKINADPDHQWNAFVEPLKFRNIGKPEQKSEDWFFSEGSSLPSSGVAITVYFGGAKRIQNLTTLN